MKKQVTAWGIFWVYILIMIFSPLSVSAEEGYFEELPEDSSVPIAEEEQDYDEIGEASDTEFEEEWNLLQTNEEEFEELMEEKGYVRFTDEEKQKIVDADPDANIDISQLPDYYISEKVETQISTYAIGGTYNDVFQTLNFNGVDSSAETDFDVFADSSCLEPSESLSSNYGVLQGGCYDGESYYFGFQYKNELGNQTDTRIVKGKFNSIGRFEREALVVDMDILRHANDLTYNRDTDELVIVCCEDKYHHIIYTIDKDDIKNGVTANKFTKHYVSAKINAIDYNATRSQYVARLSGYSNGFVILDTDFRVVKTVGYSVEDDKFWACQGLCVDNLYIYSLSYKIGSWHDEINDVYKKEYTDEIENRLRIFDWDGNLIKSYQFHVNKNLNNSEPDYRKYEAENIMVVNDKVVLGCGLMEDPQNGDGITSDNRLFALIDLSSWTYHLQFCPDEQVNNYKGIYSNGNVNAVMFRDVATPLRKFRVSIQGKQFVGWTAYRVETREWLYCDPNDRTINNWYEAGEQPPGYKKYVYADKQVVSRTGSPGGHVLMCAKWTNSSTFTVSFMKNGGSGTMSDQNITHGTVTALKTNTLTKTNRNFKFWNAYWVEKNKWYYVSSDGNTKGWYKEGYEPDGYEKYVYNNKQKVSKTVHAGGHVYMYAVWNEFYIQYDANQVSIDKNKVLEMHLAEYADGAETDLSVYEGTFKYYTYNNDAVVKKNVTLKAYSYYWREINRWMYVNKNSNTDKIWTKAEDAPSNYDLYMRSTKTSRVYTGATVHPGEHLILRAEWEEI